MGKIKNFDTLAITEERRKALLLAEAGFDAIDTKKVIRESITLEGGKLCIEERICSIEDVERVFVVGVGKCAIGAAEILEEILGDRLAGGIVLAIQVPEVCTVKKIKCYSGTHPLPSDWNIKITHEIVDLLKNLTERDLVIVVVSGGGSTLLCMPEKGATCVEERMIVEALIKAGAAIQEINTLRKHMSLARGGYLAQYAYPAQVISLIFSDVPGNDLGFIASGPTIKDTTTLDDADTILSKYNILRVCGIEHCGLIETPKDDKYFQKVTNILLVSNEHALLAMAEYARTLGLEPIISSKTLAGEARDVGREIAQQLHAAPAGTVRLYGGETTVTVRGHGKGGRNQELALSTLRFIEDKEVIVSVASDGHDNSQYAGAVADVLGREKAKKPNLDIVAYLVDNDALSFFTQTEDYLLTGDTGANISDFIIALKGA